MENKSDITRVTSPPWPCRITPESSILLPVGDRLPRCATGGWNRYVPTTRLTTYSFGEGVGVHAKIEHLPTPSTPQGHWEKTRDEKGSSCWTPRPLPRGPHTCGINLATPDMGQRSDDVHEPLPHRPPGSGQLPFPYATPNHYRGARMSNFLRRPTVDHKRSGADLTG